MSTSCAMRCCKDGYKTLDTFFALASSPQLGKNLTHFTHLPNTQDLQGELKLTSFVWEEYSLESRRNTFSGRLSYSLNRATGQRNERGGDGKGWSLIHETFPRPRSMVFVAAAKCGSLTISALSNYGNNNS